MPGFKAVKIAENVFWVGAIDWSIRDFHGYSTHRGSTYNAYLILADKVTLIDTVKAPFKEELMSRISSVIDPKKIKFIVSNHSEMDHSGCLPEVIKDIEPEKVFASVMGVKVLNEHFGIDREIIALKTGDEISLGNMTLAFTETRMLHWPDSMFSYLKERRLLFSQDAFGMHLASDERFADELPADLLEFEGATYFANILLPYSQLVLNLIEKVKTSGIELEIVAPDHGPVWKGQSIAHIIGRYHDWATRKPTLKAVVVYDTMWKSTEKMARAIEEGLVEGGAKVKLISMGSSHRSDVAYELLEAGAIVAGAPTLNNNLFPSMADMLTYIKGLKPRNLVGAAFGSYGWSGESPAQVEAYLKEMGVDIVADPLKVKWVPGAEAIEQCRQLGLSIASRLKEKV
jgi:flavorubredoxin